VDVGVEVVAAAAACFGCGRERRMWTSGELPTATAGIRDSGVELEMELLDDDARPLAGRGVRGGEILSFQI
jgi:hypothetical protein